MTLRIENPALYRENVYKSWKIMAEVVANLDIQCFVAHLEPNSGVGYDCLSLFTRDQTGDVRVCFMLNRNGVNADVLDNVWGLFDRKGVERVAQQLIKAARLKLSRPAHRSSASEFCDEVVMWIEEHRHEAFCVGPIGWPGGCHSFLDPQEISHDKNVWPVPDHGPELSLGIDGREIHRLDQTSRELTTSVVVVKKKSDRASEIESLAISIARCGEISAACDDKKHPCHKIVTTQKEFGEEYRQVPEAWVGNLEKARVLLLSSNPSISTPKIPGTGEDYPLSNYSEPTIEHRDWPVERIIDFQINRLDQTRAKPFVTTNSQFLCLDGQYRGSDSENGTKASQKYWKSAIKQGQDLLGPTFDLGRDICMTEIVHCKSKGEKGVSQASSTCSEKYLARILQFSGSLLVLVGGAKARAQVHEHRQDWQEDGLFVWDISDRFGYFRKGDSNPRDHVGLIRIQEESKIAIATEQLSYASNTNRFVQSVIGGPAFNKLVEHLRSDSPISFESREEVLNFLEI